MEQEPMAPEKGPSKKSFREQLRELNRGDLMVGSGLLILGLLTAIAWGLGRINPLKASLVELSLCMLIPEYLMLRFANKLHGKMEKEALNYSGLWFCLAITLLLATVSWLLILVVAL